MAFVKEVKPGPGLAAVTSMAMLFALLGVSSVMENLLPDEDDGRKNATRPADRGITPQDWSVE